MAAHLHTADPIETAGLFVGRGPATASGASALRPGADTTWLTRAFDYVVALGILVLEAVLVASAWIAQPLGWLWVASQVAYLSGSLWLAVLGGVAGMVASLWVTLAVLTRLDHAWKLARRAAGCDQREGCLERLFVAAAILVVPAFLVWLFVIAGPGSLVVPFRAG